MLQSAFSKILTCSAKKSISLGLFANNFRERQKRQLKPLEIMCLLQSTFSKIEKNWQWKILIGRGKLSVGAVEERKRSFKLREKERETKK